MAAAEGGPETNMHPLIFVWIGTYEDLVATGFHGFSKHGLPTRVAAIVHGKAYIGLVPAPHSGVRPKFASLSPDLVLLPGANSNLNAQHVAALNQAAPKLQVKQGDPMRAVLFYVYSLYGDGEFDPDAY